MVSGGTSSESLGMGRRHIYEIGVASLILVVCATVWAQASRLPPGSFEPLGSGPVPQWMASIAIVCCISIPIAGLLLWKARRHFKSALKAT